jgi:hypothetical protein
MNADNINRKDIQPPHKAVTEADTPYESYLQWFLRAQIDLRVSACICG